MDDLFTKAVNVMISKAINDCFTESLIYGTGYIKVTQNNDYLSIEHVPFSEVEKELLPCDLAIECAKMWSSGCGHCNKMSTTDHYKCPYCGEVKR